MATAPATGKGTSCSRGTRSCSSSASSSSSPSAASSRSCRCSTSKSDREGGMRPYTPLELAGRNIYVREGCYLCHSQMVRPMRDEVEQPVLLARRREHVRSPLPVGLGRTGPDLARVGGKYSDEWHRDHLKDPKSVVRPHHARRIRSWTVRRRRVHLGGSQRSRVGALHWTR